MDDGLAGFIESSREARPELADELEALAAILDGLALSSHDGQTATLVVLTHPSGPSAADGELVKLSIEVPLSYPALPPPPRISLVSRYIGRHKVPDTDDLASRVSSLSSASSWTPGDAVLFELIESAREIVGEWLCRRTAETPAPITADASPDHPPDVPPPLDVTLVSCEPIVDRKSVFVAHAAKLRHPSEVRHGQLGRSGLAHVFASSAVKVPRIMAHLLSDRKIARAA